MIAVEPLKLIIRVLIRPTFICAAIIASNVVLYDPAYAEHVSRGEASGACDAVKKHTCEELVQDNILWRINDPDNPAAKHWAQKNLDSLCVCTTEPYETVNCFQVAVNNKRKSWQEAIAECRAHH